MGHTGPRMIFEHYREVVTAEAARAFLGDLAMNAGVEAALRKTALRDAKNAEGEAASREFDLQILLGSGCLRIW